MKLNTSVSLFSLLALQLLDHDVIAFSPSVVGNHHQSKVEGNKAATALSSSVSKTSDMMKSLRADLAENEDANNIMKALRGQGMNDDDKAAEGVQMRLVDEDLIDDGTGLPYVYDPNVLKEYYNKRPLHQPSYAFK